MPDHANYHSMHFSLIQSAIVAHMYAKMLQKLFQFSLFIYRQKSSQDTVQEHSNTYRVYATLHAGQLWLSG